jgi:hypothetical protein
MPTVNVPFDVTIGPPRQSELHPAAHQNIPGGGDVPLRCLVALPGARPFEITQRRLEHIVLRGDRFRSRMPRAYWLTLIVLALLLVPGAGLTGWSSRGVAISPHEPQSNRLPEPEVQADKPKPKKLNPAEVEMHVIGVGAANGSDMGGVDVEVRPTIKPIVLALASYSSALWYVRIAEGARVKAVIVGGYSEQEIEGIPATIPVFY